jgi:sodium-dependent dicarboxylate transporter 2/3/5
MYSLTQPKINERRNVMNTKKRLIYTIIGPALYALIVLSLKGSIGTLPAEGLGVAAWMIFWWVTRPVDITVTALLPGVVNALFSIIPMDKVISQYSSASIILIFGSLLLTVPWAQSGLDRRIALKVLSLIGPSMKSQIAVWLVTSIVFSTVLPNVVVVAIFTPIAVAMLKAAGYEDIKTCEPAVPILCSIAWGAGIGGVGTPFGGAMNVTAIALLEEFTGKEFMYVYWLKYITPYLIICTVIILIVMLAMPLKVKKLEGAKEYFKSSYAKLGAMSRDEMFNLVLFLIALVASFLRPLYENALPTLVPAYVFLGLGFLNFFISSRKNGVQLTWNSAQKGVMWGMMILFAGGLALGQILSGSGANKVIADAVGRFNLTGGFGTVLLIGIFACAISEFSNSTVSAALTVPIVLSITTNLGLNPLPYWFASIMCYNSEILLPVSVRAISVGYGLDPNKLMKNGIVIFIVRMFVAVIVGYACIKFWPGFGLM